MSSIVAYNGVRIVSPDPDQTTAAGGAALNFSLKYLADGLSNAINANYTVTIKQDGGDDCEGPSEFDGSTVLTKNPAIGTGWYAGTPENGITLEKISNVWTLTVSEVTGCGGGGSSIIWTGGSGGIPSNVAEWSLVEDDWSGSGSILVGIIASNVVGLGSLSYVDSTNINTDLIFADGFGDSTLSLYHSGSIAFEATGSQLAFENAGDSDEPIYIFNSESFGDYVYYVTGTGDVWAESVSTNSLGTGFLSTSTLQSASGTSGLISITSPLSLTGPTISGSSSGDPEIGITQTWNTTGNPTAIKLNVTNTASGTTAKLLDLQVGGSSKFNVDKSGNLNLGILQLSFDGSGLVANIGGDEMLRTIFFTAWSDSAITSFFEVGTAGRAGMFATASGVNFSRFGICTTAGMTVTDKNYASIIAPTAMMTVDVSGSGLMFDGRKSNVSKFSVDNGGNIKGQASNFAAQSSTPTNTAASADANLYVKGGKLIAQYNDAGTVRYKYLDLTGTGVTWVHTTTAP